MSYAMQTHVDPDAARWAAVLARDAGADGGFVYAVRTTGIYCRPSCPSRRPRRDSVSFYAGPDAAEVAGFRPCRRCEPRAGTAPSPGIRTVRRACAFLERHADRPVTLARLAAHAGTSPFHLQRTFKKLVGISPRAFQEAVRAGRFRAGLRQGAPVSAAVYDAGYGSISRVYERRPTGRGMTPAGYRRGGDGLAIAYTVVDSPVGRLLVAGTAAGICSVKLGETDARLAADLAREYPRAWISRDDAALAAQVDALRAHLSGDRPHLDLPIHVRATAFQWKVWRTLQSIPYGETRAYSDVARAIGSPSAVRAVARACATNPVCLIVPCHRVVQKDGALGGYRWGQETKRVLVETESERSKVKGRRSKVRG